MADDDGHRLGKRRPPRPLLTFVVTMTWAAEFLAAWNLVQNDELAALPAWQLRDEVWVATAALLFISGAVMRDWRWPLIPLPPLVALAVLVVLDVPADRWVPSHITTGGWIVLPLLAWLITGAGALLANTAGRTFGSSPSRSSSSSPDG